MNFIKSVENTLKDFNSKNKIKKILIIDGDDTRSLAAGKLLKSSGLVEPVLLLESPIDSEGLETIVMDQETQAQFAQKFFEARKGKETLEAAQKALTTKPFFAMMLLKEQMVDGVIGGLKYTTGDILRAAFKVIGPKPGVKTISSVMIMHKGEEKFFFSDISVNVAPTAEQLAEIAKNAVDFAKAWTPQPTVAFLSFSTAGSAVTPETVKVKEATDIYNTNNSLEIPAIGEIQFDAALDLSVRASKYKQPNFDSVPNVLVFPDLNAGNIGYKIAQRLGEFGAVGPIITGVNAPINDLSRGATVEDIYTTALITAIQTQK